MADLLILSDFDGTITTQDVGVEVVKNFGPSNWKEIEQKYIAGELSSKETQSLYYENLKISTLKLIEYIKENIEIDPYFKEFYDYCQQQEQQLYILSDGMDFYIDLLLAEYNLAEIEFYCNSYQDQGGEVKTRYPYFNPQCGKCGHCKSNTLAKLHDGEFIIYIGDGYTDRCPVDKADLVFAKDQLAEFCDSNNIKYLSYQNFADVLEKIKTRF